MGIITEKVEVIPSGKTIKYYRDKGYDAKYHEPLIVNVDDLPSGSGAIVQILCDYCQKEITEIMYKDYVRRINKYGNTACLNCKPIKTRENNCKKYGVPSTSMLPDVKEKIKKTNLQNWGFECSLQNKEVRNKAIETCKKNYNVDYSIQSKEIHDKTKESLFAHFGVRNPFESQIIREKAVMTYYKNSSQKTSRQQLYIFNLYNQNNSSELNYPISYYNADICFPDEKLEIEIDCGGHNLSVKTGKLTQEEFNQKEIIRNNIIKREGYKQMRVISSKDLIPSDTTLLQMLQDTRNYFSEYPNHSWIEFNLDTSIVRNAEYKQGIPYNFGVLRKIS